MSENLETSGFHRRPCGRSVDAVWRVGCLSDTVSGTVSLPAGSASVAASTPTARRALHPPPPNLYGMSRMIVRQPLRTKRYLAAELLQTSRRQQSAA